MSGHCHWCDSALGPKEREKLEERCRNSKPTAPVEVVEQLAQALEVVMNAKPEETAGWALADAALEAAKPYRKR